MKKVLLTLAVVFTALTAAAQNTFNVVTDKMEISNMVWSETLQEHSFFEKEARTYKKVVWEVTMNNNHTGTVKVTELKDGDKYGFNIYNWEFRKDNKGQDFIWMDAIQVSNSEKVTILVSANEQKQQMISVFMPDSKIAIFFDNMDWE